ncbi:hypothetical protein [Bradyrhizobium sp. YR681]|uniref:hypothetical protein n=1 Tax=Bradyrhizobium sp. YR681 TaxID=1144344 RepID=UPI00055B3948|nr:hypothetical protein [Bradyrhizobium sp. YR681]
MPIEKTNTAADAARELAWRHFDFHAKQRVDMFKAYLTIVAILFASFGVAAQYRFYLLGGAFSLLSVILSIVFYLFDVRTRQLIKISEAYLLKEERRLATLIDDRDIQLFKKGDLITNIGHQGFRLTYTNLFRVLFVSSTGLSFVVLLFFLVCSLREIGPT